MITVNCGDQRILENVENLADVEVCAMLENESIQIDLEDLIKQWVKANLAEKWIKADWRVYVDYGMQVTWVKDQR